MDTLLSSPRAPIILINERDAMHHPHSLHRITSHHSTVFHKYLHENGYVWYK